MADIHTKFVTQTGMEDGGWGMGDGGWGMGRWGERKLHGAVFEKFPGHGAFGLDRRWAHRDVTVGANNVGNH